MSGSGTSGEHSPSHSQRARRLPPPDEDTRYSTAVSTSVLVPTAVTDTHPQPRPFPLLFVQTLRGHAHSCPPPHSPAPCAHTPACHAGVLSWVAQEVGAPCPGQGKDAALLWGCQARSHLEGTLKFAGLPGEPDGSCGETRTGTRRCSQVAHLKYIQTLTSQKEKWPRASSTYNSNREDEMPEAPV